MIYAVVAFGMAVTADQFDGALQNSTMFLQLAGRAFMIFLGIRLIFADQQSWESDRAETFQSGVILQILNPKFPAVVLAVLAARSDTDIAVTTGVIATVDATGLKLQSDVGSLIRKSAPITNHLRLLYISFGAMLLWLGPGLRSSFHNAARRSETITR